MSQRRKTIRKLEKHERDIICPVILQRQTIIRRLNELEATLAGMVLIAAGADHQDASLDLESLELYEQSDEVDCANLVIVDHAESKVSGENRDSREDSSADAEDHPGAA